MQTLLDIKLDLSVQFRNNFLLGKLSESARIRKIVKRESLTMKSKYILCWKKKDAQRILSLKYPVPNPYHLSYNNLIYLLITCLFNK